ncbi:MAG: hypothetical protein P9M14_01315 [Candidatus Alcyoniella australis]|nr:hypothetical protein [Candidatus Alcyoniella australis]
MNQPMMQIACAALIALLCLTCCALGAVAEDAADPFAEPIVDQPTDRLDMARTMHNRIAIGLGYHLYYGGSLRETGREPDGALPITPGEIRWTLRDEFDLGSYHGPAIQIEWEHLIIPQLGMAWGVGFFGGTRQLDLEREGAKFSGPYAANAVYLTLLAPRVHWRISPRFDLAGGVDVALCSFAAYYVVDVEVGGETFQLDETIYGFTPLYSAVVSLELRLSRRWGLLLTDKVSYGKIEANEGNLVIGGNTTLISAAIHF